MNRPLAETRIVSFGVVFLVVGVIGLLNPDPTPDDMAGIQMPVLALCAIGGGIVTALALIEAARSIIARRAKG